MIKKKTSFIIVYAILFFLFLVEVIPVLQVFLNSFRSDREVKAMPFGLPQNWVFTNWPDTWRMGSYGVAYWNSLVITISVIGLILSIVGLGAYALSKLQFKGREFFIAYFFVGISLPGFLYIVPNYFLFNKMGLVDTRLSLVLCYTASGIPFYMLLLRTFLGSIPRELEEAAKIDGCTKFGIYVRIFVPLSGNLFATLTILKFVATWNDFFYPLIVTTTDNMMTVQLALTKFRSATGIQWNEMMAATLMVILPVIVVFIFAQRYFVQGIVTTGIKA